MSTLVLVILLIVLVALVVVVVRFSFRTTPHAEAEVVERFGRYHRTLKAGLHVVIPVVDRVRALIDLREQMLNLRPQQMLTSDKVKVTIEAVIYFRVTDAKAATYEVADYASALQDLATTTLRAVAGGMDMETALTSANEFSSALITELGRAARGWGVQVSRADLKTLEPPSGIQEGIERQRRAELDKNAAELRAQGTASAMSIWANAEAAAQAIRANGEAEHITKVFQAIAGGTSEQQQLMLQILQTLNNRSPAFLPQPPDGSESE
jgi:regulator of protease activity HflC (stomatin/prohibitin superfamily)